MHISEWISVCNKAKLIGRRTNSFGNGERIILLLKRQEHFGGESALNDNYTVFTSSQGKYTGFFQKIT